MGRSSSARGSPPREAPMCATSGIGLWDGSCKCSDRSRSPLRRAARSSPPPCPCSEPTSSSMRQTMPTKKIEEAEEVTRCPECNSGHLSFDYERGELICEECGLVLTDQMIDQGP